MKKELAKELATDPIKYAWKTKKQSELKRIFSDFCKKLEEGTVPMLSEFVDIIDDNFWDLI